MSCVRDVIAINCGTDASGLFHDLVKAHVPSSVCEDETRDPDVKSNSVNEVQPLPRVLFLSAILLVPVVHYWSHYHAS